MEYQSEYGCRLVERDEITDEVFALVEHDINEDWQLEISGNYVVTEGNMKLSYANSYVYKHNELLINGINPSIGVPIFLRLQQTMFD